MSAQAAEPVCRKRCPQCDQRYDLEDESDLRSCEACGNPYLNELPPRTDPSGAPLPRSGGRWMIGPISDVFGRHGRL